MTAHDDRVRKDRGLARFAGSLRRRWWVVLLTLIVGGGLGYATSFLVEPQYNSMAQVSYSQRDADIVTKALTDAGIAGLAKTVSNDALVISTSAFNQRLAEALVGTVAPKSLLASIQVRAVEEVGLIEIQASSSRPQAAADLANTCAEQFISTRQQEIEEQLGEAIDFVRGRISSLTPAERVGSLGAELRQYEYALDTLLSNAVADYEILEAATAPSSPYSPRPLVNTLIGAGAGLVLGIILALLVDAVGKRFRRRSTDEGEVDLPTLASIPATSGRQGGGRLAVGFGKGSESLLDSMSALRSNLKVLGFGETKRTILVTSATDSEEKSALAIDLTLAMALSGDRVILVDADLRRPRIDGHLGIPNNQGLGDVLTDASVEWSETIQAVDLMPLIDQATVSAKLSNDGDSSISKFLCLTGGNTPPDPAAALGSGMLSTLLADLQGYSDYVIVDGPPASSVSESLILANAVDAVVITSTLGKQTAAQTRQVRRLLARAEIEPLGVILCGARGGKR